MNNGGIPSIDECLRAFPKIAEILERMEKKIETLETKLAQSQGNIEVMTLDKACEKFNRSRPTLIKMWEQGTPGIRKNGSQYDVDVNIFGKYITTNQNEQKNRKVA